MPEQTWLIGTQLDNRTLQAWREEAEHRIEQIKAHQLALLSAVFEERAIRQELAWRRTHRGKY